MIAAIVAGWEMNIKTWDTIGVRALHSKLQPLLPYPVYTLDHHTCWSMLGPNELNIIRSVFLYYLVGRFIFQEHWLHWLT